MRRRAPGDAAAADALDAGGIAHTLALREPAARPSAAATRARRGGRRARRARPRTVRLEWGRRKPRALRRALAVARVSASSQVAERRRTRITPRRRRPPPRVWPGLRPRSRCFLLRCRPRAAGRRAARRRRRRGASRRRALAADALALVAVADEAEVLQPAARDPRTPCDARRASRQRAPPPLAAAAVAACAARRRRRSWPEASTDAPPEGTLEHMQWKLGLQPAPREPPQPTPSREQPAARGASEADEKPVKLEDELQNGDAAADSADENAASDASDLLLATADEDGDDDAPKPVEDSTATRLPPREQSRRLIAQPSARFRALARKASEQALAAVAASEADAARCARETLRPAARRAAPRSLAATRPRDRRGRRSARSRRVSPIACSSAVGHKTHTLGRAVQVRAGDDAMRTERVRAPEAARATAIRRANALARARADADAEGRAEAIARARARAAAMGRRGPRRARARRARRRRARRARARAARSWRLRQTRVARRARRAAG